MASNEGIRVKSTIGEKITDDTGAPVGVVKMEPEKAYAGISSLLQRYINESDENAWQEIAKRIDYIYENINVILNGLNEETGFGNTVQSMVKNGKKLLFKPNLVFPSNIDAHTHGESMGSFACTEWAFVAAVMRWFHDKLSITYHQMMLGEAASAMSTMRGFYNLHYFNDDTITNEAVMEGRSGDFYGGWGFYFVRKYLEETHDASHSDSPMNGYEESIAGRYITPGKATDKLMVYDLNRLYDDVSKGREVTVPGGANYQRITIHKVIIGGDPDDKKDIEDYPGCVLVNVPKLKQHDIDLITNAVKNLGIGLYPQESPVDSKEGSTRWEYSYPFDLIPGMKTELPHERWIHEMKDDSYLPVKDKDGNYILKRTGGMSATQADVISATLNQDIFMVHIVDAVEIINFSNIGTGIKISEGYAMTSLDPVALDLFCVRYCIKTIPMAEAGKLKAANNLPTDFLQKVSVAEIDGTNIKVTEGFDSPLFRYNLYNYAAGRGIGKTQYRVFGRDSVTATPLYSVDGHLGRVENDTFHELMTANQYYGRGSMLWDLQKTIFSYAKANDSLTGSTCLKELLEAFDDDGDGIIQYEESGKKGYWKPVIRSGAYAMNLRASEKYGFLKGPFISQSFMMRHSNKGWNSEGHDFMKEPVLVSAMGTAYQMAGVTQDAKDIFIPSMTWGNGKLPSIQFAGYFIVANAIYGLGFPSGVALMSLYGHSFQYADKTMNNGDYTGTTYIVNDEEAANKYIREVAEGKKPLQFVVYVPAGYGKSAGIELPNIEETADPDKLFSAHFNDHQEVWRG